MQKLVFPLHVFVQTAQRAVLMFLNDLLRKQEDVGWP